MFAKILKDSAASTKAWLTRSRSHSVVSQGSDGFAVVRSKTQVHATSGKERVMADGKIGPNHPTKEAAHAAAASLNTSGDEGVLSAYEAAGVRPGITMEHAEFVKFNMALSDNGFRITSDSTDAELGFNTHEHKDGTVVNTSSGRDGYDVSVTHYKPKQKNVNKSVFDVMLGV